MILQQIFTPDLSVYDILIHLSSGLPRSRLAVKYSWDKSEEARELKPYSYEPNELIPILGFDPVQMYLRDLRVSTEVRR